MQTVYILKNCVRSYSALVKIYKSPNLTTSVIFVGKKQAKILLLDKRVKEFPFIINTLPSSNGLIPKSSKVMPLRLFISLRAQYQRLREKHVKKPRNKITQRNTITKIESPDGGIEIVLNK